jgi:hypothetical protein
MKLSNWAKKQGIAYITAWRWFNEGRLPVKAYRSDSGTIIVQDETDTPEQVMVNPQSNDVMSMVLKKTVEFSKNSGTVEDFAAWVLSTFALKLNSINEKPSYSRNKPKPEEVQKHFEQFLKPKGEKPKPSMFVAPAQVIEETAERQGWSLVSGEQISKTAAKVDASKIDTVDMTDIPELSESINDLFSQPNYIVSNNFSTEGVITRSVESTPQLNYTGSTNAAFSSTLMNSNITAIPTANVSNCSSVYFDQSRSLADSDSSTFVASYNNTFGPTQKESESAATLATKLMEAAVRPRRGRKPFKTTRKPE